MTDKDFITAEINRYRQLRAEARRLEADQVTFDGQWPYIVEARAYTQIIKTLTELLKPKTKGNE